MHYIYAANIHKNTHIHTKNKEEEQKTLFATGIHTYSLCYSQLLSISYYC